MVSKHIGPQYIADQNAKADARGVDTQRHGPLSRRIKVGDNGCRRRRPACLAHANAHACDQQMPEIAGKTGQRRHARPHGQRQCDDVAAVSPVGPHCDRYAQRGVKRRKRQSGQKPQLPVMQAQISLDRL